MAHGLPDARDSDDERYEHGAAGDYRLQVHRDAHTLGPWAGFGWMCLFVAVVLVVAFALLERRDA